MPRILVLCQRKKSFDTKKNSFGFTDNFIVNVTTDRIEKYVKRYFKGQDVYIEYLIDYGSNTNMYDADFKFHFEPNSSNTKIRIQSYQFIREHIGVYDMIILQTCPMPYFIKNFKHLPTLMTDDGVVTIRTFSTTNIDGSFDINTYVMYDGLCKEEFEKYFKVLDSKENLYERRIEI